ncbi:DNA polymerase IV [Ilumatobacter nonamiensis]|uniref:DNA polymerase IV n=1 Tax=Ilumatobacter nonamiensis TaxID=467093 RepID=UPI000349E8BD
MCERVFVKPTASILHADLDSFYASVEQRDDPSLRGKPVVAGGGVVLAASYEAKRYGVRTAMPEHKARRLCPDLIVVPARFDAYSQASKDVFEIFHDTSPLVEGISIDEAFLDVTGLRTISGTPVEIASKLRADVRDKIGLPITVGVARTKFLAKVASGVGKPDGLLLVEPEGELDFLHPLPVDKLWGVGAITAAKLDARGIRTVGEVAAMDLAVLTTIVGVASGRQLHALAHNVDARRVETGRRRGSIGSQQALGRRPRTRDEIAVVLLRLVDRVTRRMRRADRAGRTVTLRFRFADFTRATRASSLPQPTSATTPLLATARAVLDQSWEMIDERGGLTLIGLSIGNLVDVRDGVGIQLSLPFERSQSDVLDTALDAVRDRFGAASLTRAATVGSNADFGVPMLPD